MKRPSFDHLTDLQRQIMNLVWDLREASVSTVQSRLQSQGKVLAYTSVLTMLRRLEKAGWLRHRSEGRTFVYLPAFSKEAEAAHAFRRLLDRLFQGRAGLLVQHLIESEALNDGELAEIKRMIARRKRRIGT
jgi:predicted transcriptional regulator